MAEIGTGVSAVVAGENAKAVNRVRAMLRDTSDLNALVEGVESSDAMLELMLEFALDDWNTKPPLSQHSIDDHPSSLLLTMKAVALTLESAAILQARNRLTYNDGGISVQVSDKAQAYLAIADRLNAKYEQQALRWKRAKNAERCYGGVSSSYASLASAVSLYTSGYGYARIRSGFAS